IPVYKELTSIYSISEVQPSDLFKTIRKLEQRIETLEVKLEEEHKANVLMQTEIPKLNNLAERWEDDIETLEAVIAAQDKERLRLKMLTEETGKFQEDNK